MRYPVTYCLLCILFSFTTMPAHGDNLIYHWQELNKTFFSDRPHANARTIELQDRRPSYRVKRVIDGDTVLLSDDTKIRLLGINTPEIANRYHAAEAGGKRAKHWLSEQLQGEMIHLETDTEKVDKYGRTLAHIFTLSGKHINLQLVQRGLAAVSIYPPNLKYASALIAAQAQAEQHRLGLWNDPAYAIKKVNQLTPDNQQGWQRITGVVQNIRQSRRYYYLDFSDHFNVRIQRSNAHLFPNFATYVGRKVEVRGWVNQQQGQLSLLIRHPDALRL